MRGMPVAAGKISGRRATPHCALTALSNCHHALPSSMGVMGESMPSMMYSRRAPCLATSPSRNAVTFGRPVRGDTRMSMAMRFSRVHGDMLASASLGTTFCCTPPYAMGP
jgi:hypothetical protein